MPSDRHFNLQQYPLSWPDGWKRSVSYQRKSGIFKLNGQRASVNAGINRILEQLRMMGISRDDVLISTNVPTRLDGLPRSDAREPADPGAAVYWRKKQDGPMSAIAIDIYNRVADNLCAIAATFEAMRAIERHGGAQVQERTFRGFAALPASTSTKPWREVLNLQDVNNPDRSLVNERFRRLAAIHHPDRGGSQDKMAELSAARDEALREIGGAQ